MATHAFITPPQSAETVIPTGALASLFPAGLLAASSMIPGTSFTYGTNDHDASLLRLCAQFQEAAAEIARLDASDGEHEDETLAQDELWWDAVTRLNAIRAATPAGRRAKAKAAFTAALRQAEVERDLHWLHQVDPAQMLMMTTLLELAGEELAWNAEMTSIVTREAAV